MTAWSNALFRNVSHSRAGLPYNLNWRRHDWRRLSDLFRVDPLHLIDIGARGGAPPELEGLARFIDVVAFDADAREAERLSEAAHGYRSLRVLPFFVGDSVAPQKFYVYTKPGLSSARQPNPALADFFPDFQIEYETTVDSTTLDELGKKGILQDVDFLKLDTQGTEHEILSAGSWALERAVMVEIEIEYVEIYEGQKLAFDIERLMHERGFDPLYLSRVFTGRASYNGESRGQLIFGDVLFGVREERARQLPLEKLARYVLLLIAYGHMDFAHALYRGTPALQRAFPQFADMFRLYRVPISTLRRFLVMQYDKLLAIALHLRRTNHLRSDSDRSWPVR
jgi:FkbM family methyltransferase